MAEWISASPGVNELLAASLYGFAQIATALIEEPLSRKYRQCLLIGFSGRILATDCSVSEPAFGLLSGFELTNLPATAFSKHCVRHEIFDVRRLSQLLC